MGQGTESIGDADAAEWARAVGGDGEAFGRIFDRHRDRVLRHGLRLAPTPSDADDLVAITFFEAWRNRERVRVVEGSVLPWLLVTATNVGRNLRRSAGRYAALLERLPPGEHAADPADHVAAHDVAARLAHLSLADRQVLTLCVLEGYSERDAAVALGVAPGTVKSRLSRARRRLASALASQGGHDEP
ncbi:RNA polymerase sigma factor [Pseudolysinimonas yzui]|uniref:Siderophore-interacting protein n=1 Tax=Pseudolysinimonas yzui TaxID=2708254 RepID=A0A8J3GS48_9MICO|nr:RNA polymerase sigma factor [Pseudolysinimonas yzui]GHF24266.1 siderophore-interacting protein [Pseudolysinimonas yzui]